MSLEIKNRRLQWFGHVLRMPSERITNVALGWTPTGRRKRAGQKPPGGGQR